MSRGARVLPLKPTDYFTVENWTELISIIEPIAEELVILAKRVGVHISGDSRWPRIRVSRRRFLKVRYADLALQSNYLNDHKERWDLQLQELMFFWIFFYKPLSHKVTKSFLSNELDIARPEIRQALDEMLSYVKSI